MKAIVQSLSQSVGVRKLELIADTVYPENTTYPVNASRAISELGFNVFYPCEVGMFARQLCETQWRNYILRRIHLY